jgi:carboxyl-terminal processing protease
MMTDRLTPKDQSLPQSGRGLYEKALNMLQEDYFDAVKAKNLSAWKDTFSARTLSNPHDRDAAIRKLAGSLHDPWTEYVSNSDQKHLDALSRAGYRDSGIWTRPDSNGYPEVQTVRKGFAAHDTPIRAGDKIERINGVDVYGRSEIDVEKMLLQKTGKKMSIEFQRKDGGREVANYTMRDFQEQDSEAKVITGNNGEKILHAYLPEFQLKSLDDFDSAIDRVLKENPDPNMPMLLDLRGNSGGTMRAERYIDSEFLTDGVAYKQEIRDGAGTKIEDVPVDESLTQSASPTDSVRISYLRHAPVVILIDDASRSAAESVTASLRARGRTCGVVGQQSFGKGIYYNDFDLGVGRLRISDGLVRSPNGEEWHGKGLVPDILVERNRQSDSPDDQIAAAIERLENKKCK